MAKKKTDSENTLVDKEKVINEVRNLITDKDVRLDTKFLHSHQKVALFYHDHVIELCGGENKHIKYMALNVPLTAKEHKEILASFMDEVKKRREETSLKKFNELKSLLKR